MIQSGYFLLQKSRFCLPNAISHDTRYYILATYLFFLHNQRIRSSICFVSNSKITLTYR
ncbi:hypothetical protein WN55_05186 [Dufourea novaeangliae]|uniref:Uncharacterized protein n=1 Tax=Dufourea novaeangliae TaxID=178035 RepID=A0A154PQH8_DUFNO|nr:hypothetical protein WN55_05186 [Dufourea novaeangliae]